MKKDGAPIELAFNPDYVQDGLSAIGEVAVLAFKEPSSAALLTEDGKSNYRYVVMPVSINQ